jgi:hypothetical protein
MNPLEEFYARKAEHIRALGEDRELRNLRLDAHTSRYLTLTISRGWRPVIHPTDLMVLRKLSGRSFDLIMRPARMWSVDLLSASMLELIGGDGEVWPRNRYPATRAVIEKHPLARRISMIGLRRA